MTTTEANDPAMSAAARLLTTPPPPVDEAAAVSILKEAYGLSGTVKKLIGERDQNFLVDLDSGERRVLKCYNGVDDELTRDFQHGALIHMEGAGINCPVPGLYRTSEGAAEFSMQLGKRLQNGILISFMPGTAASSAPTTPKLRLELGRICAEIGKALQDFDHPIADRVLLWDHMQLSRLSSFISVTADAERRNWLERFIERFREEIEPAARRLPRQVIHNDLTGSNIFVYPNDSGRISGVIDFGDIVRAPRVNELAVAASYFMSEHDDPVQAIGDVVAGYSTVRQLQEPEVAQIYDLVLARVALRLLIYEWRVVLFPENRDYILRNSVAAWRLLDWFAEQDDHAGRIAILDGWKRRSAAP